MAAGPGARSVYPANYTAECGACHVPYPPHLLDRKGWDTLMRRLDRHFGTDAGLDPKTTADIADWLLKHSGPQSSPSVPPRITNTVWFRREHRELPDRIWRSPPIKSAANCAACHPGAELGRFAERDIRVPGFGRKIEED